MNKLNIIYMGTPDFSVPALDELNKNYNILAVVTQPDKEVGRKRQLKAAPVKEYAINNNINPTVLTVASTFGFSLEPLIFSIIKNNTLPPSNAGNGIKFINPIFIDKYAVKYNNVAKLLLASLTTLYIPTGPDKLSIPSSPLNKLPIIMNIDLYIETNLSLA